MSTQKEQNWQSALQNTVTSLEELCAIIPAARAQASEWAKDSFALKVGRRYLAKIDPNDPNDPLLLQILPQKTEEKTVAGFVADPLNEHQYNPLPGLIHKYRTRVLITLTGTCAIHCRYCFRRHFAYDENRPGTPGLERIYDYLRQHPEINEVILSGGDPLLVSDALLQKVTRELALIPNIQRLRIHTRLLSTLPERITPELIQALCQTRLKIILVSHCNHPRELDDTVAKHCRKLIENGVTLLNQSVFLAGVNDDAQILVALSEALFQCQILPYYLHSLDPVAGSAHFALSFSRQKEIYAAMQKQLPGFLLPRWVKEVPGAEHKMIVGCEGG